MKKAGNLFIIVGIIGAIVFGIKALNQSEAISLFGLDIAVSSANWTPVIISVLLIVVGLLLSRK